MLFFLFCFLSQASDLQIQMTKEPQKKPAPSQPLQFGKTFTDHMLMVEWNSQAGWGPPRIQPFQNLTLHPACSGLHYSLQVGLAASVPTLLHACMHPLCFRLTGFRRPGASHISSSVISS